MSTSTLHFMGEPGNPEVFRCRVYGGDLPGQSAREAFLEALESGEVYDCEAYDEWIEKLQERGWVESEIVPHPTEQGARAKLWRLSEVGRAAWERIKGETK